uniref:uncharacterized protein LOC120343972 isoform X1 n=1 Tax=Styela clava TaxID=7725 RepID=UPI001939A510|nr:uncharacterized protein LOC120343972 isoform X1 [Styela clava]
MCSIISLLAYLTVISCMTSALPDDWTPKRIVTSQRNILSFTGMGVNGEFRELIDLQEVKTLNEEWAVVTARNTIFVLDLRNISNKDMQIKFSQMIAWESDNSSIDACKDKTNEHRKCNNFIRINAQVSKDQFLICGTNARQPKCRQYEWNGHRFTDFYEGERCTDAKTCLLDDEPSLAYAYSRGNLYLATRVDHRRSPTIRRDPVDDRLASINFNPNLGSSGNSVTKDDPLPYLATGSANNEFLLNDPIFVSSFETSEKIYFFFRETAYEQLENGEVTISRVAQVCKNDKGGSAALMSHKWTSYFKARLNCSIPGNRPFHFNELRHMTSPLIINGLTTVFAVLTTPENSIWGSAVCAYTVPEIEKAMDGDFIKRTSNDATSRCWSKHGQNAPKTDPHPSACPGDEVDTRTFENTDLRFRRDHPFMKRFVQPITDQPLFMRTQAKYLFSAIDVETGFIDTNGRNLTLFYIGTSDGKLLKVLPHPFRTNDRHKKGKPLREGAFIEEWHVYHKAKCGKPVGKSLSVQQDEVNKEWENPKREERVIGVKAIKNRNFVIVSFRNCTIIVPKQLCSEITCRKSCVQSGNPYCGWLDGECVPVTPKNMEKVEQDLFGSRTDLTDCDDSGYIDENMTGGSSIEKNECPPMSAAVFAVPIAVSIASCCLLMLFVFFVYTKCKKRYQTKRYKQHGHRKPNISPDQSYTKENISHASRKEPNRQPIYKGPKNSNGSMSAALTASRPSSFTGQSIPDGPSNNIEDISESATAELRQRDAYDSTESIPSTFSPVTSDESERQNIPTGSKFMDRTKHSVDSREEYPNLNNNNTMRNIGVVSALYRTETPVRRRSITSQDQVESMPRRGIRMGISYGINSNTTTLDPQAWKHDTSKVPNIMSIPPAFCDDQSTGSSAKHGFNWRSGTLPKPPTSGLLEISPQAPLMVSKYSEIDSAQSRTFKRGQSLKEPYYSELPLEPDYENFKQRKASTPGDFGCRQPPTPPPQHAKHNRKFSSFTTSHFNTSWFPAPTVQDELKHIKIEGPEDFSCKTPSSSSSSGITNSASFASDTAPADTQYADENAFSGKCQSTKTRGIVRSADEGYGSEFVPGEDRRNVNTGHQFPSITETDCPVYDDVPFENNFVYQNTNWSPSDENNVDWKESKINFADISKTWKKKKQFRKKKNAEKRSFVPERPSPDLDNVFNTEMNSTMSNFFTPVTSGFHGTLGHALDDNFVERNSPEIGENIQPNQYAFHTMRPPGRMRQKLPRLRCGPKESDATLIAVPTPEIPKT